MKYWSHDSAIIDPGAEIGEGTKIWHWTHISAKAKLGEQCVLGQNCFVADNVIVGNGVKIQNNVSLYDGVILEDEVFCGPSVVFTNVINPRAGVERKTEFRQTLVKRGASIGANATIICGVTLGEYCLIGAGAVVTKDINSYAIVTGVPAKQTGWVSEAGEILDLPVSGEASACCPKSGARYVLSGHSLEKHKS
jgi:UDP-2-acetamido-3-amino-2,3-dideoxy-glucuronate N-acetyltransferase